MMTKLKTSLSLLLAVVILISLSVTAAHAEEPKILTKDDILAMNKSELLTTLKENGLQLPDDYATHPELAEGFVYKYTPMIMDGTVDTSVSYFNYDQSNEMLTNLGKVLFDLGLIANNVRSVRSTYTLQHSTILGSWSSSYENYNCYAYAIGKTYALNPGSISRTSFSLTMTTSEMADVVIADLAAEGYRGYKTQTKPSLLPDEYFRVIVIRKDTGNMDYHFMKFYNNSLNVWVHKPSKTQLLKWNYSSPEARTWTNERVINGVVYEPTVTYESAIYYIIYKHEDDPGIQISSINSATE